MGLFAKLKQFLPPSSRSFHGMYQEMVESNWVVKDTGLKLYEMDARFNERLDQLERRLDAHDAHVKLFAWALYRQEGETYDQTRLRFFREMPEATGSLRLLQLGCAKLLSEFDELCQQHGLTYWLTSGTLIGAIRHQGFVPWDDDVDLAMPRADILRLIGLLKDSDRYRVTVIYDYYVHCRQVRFRYADEAVPCFLDLFIYDYTASASEDVLMRQRALRDQMVAQMDAAEELAHWNYDDPCIDAGRDDAVPIAALFDQYVQRERETGDYVDDAAEAQGLIWSLDNLDDGVGHGWRVAPLDVFLPVRRVPFEGVELPIPNQAEWLLQHIYGDILQLPGDINSHFSHVTDEELKSDAAEQALRDLLD